MSLPSQPDGLDDEVRDQIRAKVTLVVTLGGIAAEHIARERERQARMATAASRARTGEERLMWDAERAIAVGRLAAVVDDRWWDNATEQDIQLAWQDAAAWRAHDPKAAEYAEAIKEQLWTRFEVDPDAPGLPEPVDLAAERAARDRRAQMASQVEAAVVLDTVDRAEEGLPAHGRSAGQEPVHQPEVAADAGADPRTPQERQRLGRAVDLQMTREFGPDWYRREDLARPAEERKLGYAGDSVRFAREWAQADRGEGRVSEPVPRAAREGAGGWDSTDRRRDMADRMRAAGASAESVEAALLADVAQGRTPGAAGRGRDGAPGGERRGTSRPWNKQREVERGVGAGR